MYGYLYSSRAAYIFVGTCSLVATIGLIQSRFDLVAIGFGLAMLMTGLPLVLNKLNHKFNNSLTKLSLTKTSFALR